MLVVSQIDADETIHVKSIPQPMDDDIVSEKHEQGIVDPLL